MNLKEFYHEINEDFNEVQSRLLMEKLIMKYLMKFLEDNSFSKLQETLNMADLEKAFRASHTLKGISSHLGFTLLQKKCDLLTECLRTKNDLALVPVLFQDVSDEYHRVRCALEHLRTC